MQQKFAMLQYNTHTHTQRPSIQPYSQSQNIPLTCTGLDMAAEASVAPQQINPKLPALVKKKKKKRDYIFHLLFRTKLHFNYDVTTATSVSLGCQIYVSHSEKDTRWSTTLEHFCLE